MDNIETNRQLQLAETIIEKTGCSLFLTGRAGTGKTTFLRNLRAKSRKRMVVCAPTGIAAINAGGMTLHSFFQLDFGIHVPGMKRDDRKRMAFNRQKIKMIQGLDLLVIDEISMVRADLLDAVDEVLRRYRDRNLPFGGLQLLLIGDLQQLPPVVTESERLILEKNYKSPYFFDSHALSQTDYLTIELDKVYRQNDAHFLDLLNAVRDNKADYNVLNELNARHIAGFRPNDSDGYVRLTTHNHLAESINNSRLTALQTPLHKFTAEITGNFPSYSCPAEPTLLLKEGAQVMFIKNDVGADRKFFNGMMGKVTTIDEQGVVVTPDDGSGPIDVAPMEWENVKYEIDEQTKEINQKVEGTFSQLPLKLAWAITIHKSQGLTFDKAIIDASGAFSHGQTYVALSRCRSLEGLVLDQPLTPQSIISDMTVRNFINTHAISDLNTEAVNSLKDAYELHLAAQMFNFRPVFNALEGITRLYNENFLRLYPTQVQDFAMKTDRMRDEMNAIGDKFCVQLRQLSAGNPSVSSNQKIQQRIKDASAYFLQRVDQLLAMADAMPIEHDNRNVASKLKERFDIFYTNAQMRQALLSAFATEEFSVNRYMDMKAAGAFRKRRPRPADTMTSEETADNRHPKLFDALRIWRKITAFNLQVQDHAVLHTRTLLAIANNRPEDYQQLLKVSGVGAETASKYGSDILQIVQAYNSGKLKDNPVYGTVYGNVSKPATVKKKSESAKLSYSMFCEGKGVEEIAKERNFKESTIYKHILDCLDFNDRELTNRLLTPERRAILEPLVKDPANEGLTMMELLEKIKQQTGLEFTSVEINVARRPIKLS